MSTVTIGGLDKEDYMKELVMTKYLEGLKELFDKYGVTQAYSYEPFANTKEDGVVIWANVGREGENASWSTWIIILTMRKKLGQNCVHFA